MLQRSQHPTALLFHVGFKVAALLMYLFGGLYVPSLTSVSCILHTDQSFRASLLQHSRLDLRCQAALPTPLDDVHGVL
jgi:hypothetical protein